MSINFCIKIQKYNIQCIKNEFNVCKKIKIYRKWMKEIGKEWERNRKGIGKEWERNRKGIETELVR